MLVAVAFTAAISAAVTSPALASSTGVTAITAAISAAVSSPALASRTGGFPTRSSAMAFAFVPTNGLRR